MNNQYSQNQCNAAVMNSQGTPMEETYVPETVMMEENGGLPKRQTHQTSTQLTQISWWKQRKNHEEEVLRKNRENMYKEERQGYEDSERNANEIGDPVEETSLSREEKQMEQYKGKKGYMVIKFNFEKAYDRVDEITDVIVTRKDELDSRHKVDKITDVIVTRKDELDSRHELPDHSGVSEEKIPVIGISFGSLSLAQKFYENYAKKVGFVTKIRNTNFDKTLKESKIPVNQSIQCTREGYRESRVNVATWTNRITATRCRARMYVMLDKEKESWVVSRLELRHSHPCLAKKAVHYHEYRELAMHAKCVITDNDEASIKPNKTYLALANEVGGSSNLSFSEKNVRNYITRKLRCADDNADFKGMMNYFVRMKEINPNFFYAIDVDDANKFRSALRVDVRCKASYEYYGDVVSFDTTYRRNRHGLPFAFFVGVNHHGKSTLLGCALLGREKIPSFEWVFTQWVRCVGTAPRGIITDQCKAMTGAIRKVLPDIVHRWCI
ncbi:protein FAR-RED IMPAIRED RESPONSE 1-like [Arachis ipaensis]|uniref:protein FAR-RED IMPAIRED RESPONSE 1-like n=1 Tax=Arachis ipaensis TaxID=130454 RepID=UPI0007AF8DB8|nr:protein FAR-RED IMPAIRED RESPONSE 1-like [Arachis ipaensis]XP_025635809.1 protein FAR-RED IMPAIRED RESPONSE 1-like [Arachis hypogaea]